MTRNIGVAIAIPEGPAAQLEMWRERFGDPAARLMSAHITLLPPTRVSDLAPVITHMQSVARRHDAFPVVLSGTGTFRPLSPVTYVRVARGVRQIETLEADVRSGPLARGLRFEYHPHVTVAHDVSDETLDWAQRELADFEARFVVEAITVYEQGPGGVWSPLDRCPLRAGA